MKDELLEQIISLVRIQGELVKNSHNVESIGEAIMVKPGDANFVTVFDETVQKNLIEGLKKILPEAVFFAEEKDNSTVDTVRGFCFIIDPIDGTTNFIHEMGVSGISVGLFKDGKPFIGVIYDPYRDEMFYARAGQGAFMNGKPIHVSRRELGVSLCAFGTAPYDREKMGRQSIELAYRLFMNCADIRRSGSATIDIVNVACGRTDAFAECKLSPWDYAAGLTILSEAGASVSDFDGNNLPLNTPSSFVCSNGVIYKQLLKIITEED